MEKCFKKVFCLTIALSGKIDQEFTGWRSKIYGVHQIHEKILLNEKIVMKKRQRLKITCSSQQQAQEMLQIRFLPLTKSWNLKIWIISFLHISSNYSHSYE